jgi:aconitate hydratase
MSSRYLIKKNFVSAGKKYSYVSLPALETKGIKVEKLPLSIRIIAESLMRNEDGTRITDADIENVLNWSAKSVSDSEVPLIVARVLMQDFTGVPAVVDLASMRDKMKSMGKDPALINPSVPVDLVVDHSVQVDFYGDDEAFDKNIQMEFKRNYERYKFLKWAKNSFSKFRIVPPGVGIVHQVNLEYLAKVVATETSKGDNIAFFDSLVGTDSHTTMINGLGIFGFGVGGIEAEAAMLNEPVTFQLPAVVGVNLHGKLREGITATDLVLTLTNILRKANVVGKFVEFFGDGVSQLSVPDRATVSNMCPEYGATVALFPVDDRTIDYLELTGRSKDQIDLVKKYLHEQGMFGVPEGVEYSELIDLDLSTVKTTISGPRLPQQKTDLADSRSNFLNFLEGEEAIPTGRSQQKQVNLKRIPLKIKGKDDVLTDGDVVIAAITSCTNTSNQNVMVAAGLLAKKAVEKGLHVNPKVKTSLAPGSRVVTEYLEKSGLQKYLDDLGFFLAGYGCTTCIGNSGPLDPAIESAINEGKLSVSAVLSGNRNFEARIHKDVRANYLMSPPLVVAFALAGTVVIDLEHEPIGTSSNGSPVFLKDLWPTSQEIDQVLKTCLTSTVYKEKYHDLDSYNKSWSDLPSEEGETYNWDQKSTYIRNPTFFDHFTPGKSRRLEKIENAYALLVLGDSITTDHISPAGSISKSSPAGKYLLEHGVDPADFNSYGSRRGNHEVMMRGTFANPRIKNQLVKAEGGNTIYFPENKEMSVFDAAMKYMQENKPLIVFSGKEYGAGSSRDWAAKGPFLLGIKAVIAESYERIHRSNLVGMGIVPLQFRPGRGFAALNADTSKPFSIIFNGLQKGTAKLSYTDMSGKKCVEDLLVRIDNKAEEQYFERGGILQNAMTNILSQGN